MRRPLLLNPKVKAVAKARFRPGLADLVLRANQTLEVGETVALITPLRRQLSKPVVVAISNYPIPVEENA